MLRLIKQLLWAGLLAAGLQTTFGFTPAGPLGSETWQAPVIGYELAGDVNTPKNLDDEYRRNTPVMYYACDDKFSGWFGTDGIAAVDGAFRILNNLQPVSCYSYDLSEFPLRTMRKNNRAEALCLLDLKSETLQLLVEQLGLASPERYVWTLHDRLLPSGGTCPYDMEYLVVKRNFDPALGTSLDQLKPTSYINGTLYTYEIEEFCSGPDPLAIAFGFPVDPIADQYTAVANVNTAMFGVGRFFTGLTRDDVGGLRYLLRTNNVNIERLDPTATAFVTNEMPQLLYTSNLMLFASQALTNDPAALQTLYPGLIDVSASNYFVNVFTTNSIPYYTNYPWDPIGTPAHLVFATNTTAEVQTRYVHNFANVLAITSSSSRGWVAVPMLSPPTTTTRVPVTLQTTWVGITNPPYMPIGSTNITTNVTSVTYYTNAVAGDFFIMPTNACEIALLYPQLTNVITVTNDLASATNAFANTNVVGTSLSYSQSLITYFTNHAFVYYPISCDSSNVARRQGIDKITFIRREYDSLLSRLVYPITNEYTINILTADNSLRVQRVRRVVTQPDFLFTAQDIATGPGDPLLGAPWGRRNLNFSTNAGAGPGVITTPTVITYDKVGPAYLNYRGANMVDTNAFILTEQNQRELFCWGSFDGTTNAPIVYPNDVSIESLETLLLVQVTPGYLPDGLVGQTYSAQLQCNSSTPGFRPPYYWYLAPTSPGLPWGLTLVNNDDNSAYIEGTPTTAGFYDFVIRVIDSGGNVVDRSFSIKINP